MQDACTTQLTHYGVVVDEGLTLPAEVRWILGKSVNWDRVQVHAILGVLGKFWVNTASRYPIMFRSPARIVLLSTLVALTGCVGPNPPLGPSFAEPNTRPARNFTSFAGALDCMDGLLAKSKRGRFLISSTDIPDETNKIRVGADDMLINALSRMNRTSQRYVFVDQSRIKFGGLLDTEVQNGDEVVPQLYIRGSISQLDTDTADDKATPDGKPSGGNLIYANFGPYRTLSVVSLDMHLVAYPSRRVLPGSSVANSMVVVRQGFKGYAKGLIDLAEIGLSISVNRVESESQAVRNLVELGLIELIGRHAGVPYWTCLAAPETNAKKNERREKWFTRTRLPSTTPQVQKMLAALGYLSVPFEEGLGPKTRSAIARFQADEDMLPNGIVDFDLSERLRLRTEERLQLDPNPKRSVQAAATPTRAAPKTPPVAEQTQPRAAKARRVSNTPAAAVPTEARGVSCPTSAPGKPCDDSYINLQDFLKTQN